MRISDWSSDVCSSDLAQAGIEPEHRLRTGGRGQQQVLEVVAEHVDRLALGLFARLVEQVEHQVQLQLRAPGQAAGIGEPGIGGAATGADAGVQRDAALGVGVAGLDVGAGVEVERSEEHTSELQSLMRNSYAVFCLKKKNKKTLNK